MYVMKGGEVVGKYDVNTDIDSIIFYKPEPHYSTFTDPRDGQTYITVEIGDSNMVCRKFKLWHNDRR